MLGHREIQQAFCMVNAASVFLDLGRLGALGSFREGGAAAGRAALDSFLGIKY
jgi:hypothetical protein